MKKILGLLFLAVFSVSSVLAQDASDKQLASVNRFSRNPDERTAIDLFQAESSYVFKSKITNNGDFGEQDAIDSSIEYSHRFLITGKIYLRLGVGYGRFDFGNTTAPLPDHLQYIESRIALEYMVGNDIGAFIQFNPGFYMENDIGISSFDVPITLGRAFILQKDRLFLFVGVNTAFLRGQYPVLPLVGLVWRATPEWTLNLLLPEPRITYSPNKNFDFWLGGQLLGGSFRTDRNNNILPRKLNGAQVDYSEYRAGLGLSYNPSERISFDLAGGYVFQRRFNFERADEDYKADGAPFVRLSVNAEF